MMRPGPIRPGGDGSPHPPVRPPLPTQRSVRLYVGVCANATPMMFLVLGNERATDRRSGNQARATPVVREGARMRVVAVLAIALVWLSLSAPFVPAQSTSDVSAPPVWIIGDSWTYQNADGRTTSTVTVSGVIDSGYSLISKGSTTGATASVFHVSRDIIGLSNFFRPQWPLDKGRSWHYEFTGVSGSGERFTYINTYNVAETETVTVPAGTFNAVHINGDEVISGRTRHYQFVVWYAPQVKNYVKIDYIGGGWTQTHPTVLLSYELH